MAGRIKLRTTGSVVKEIETVDARIRHRAYELSRQPPARRPDGPSADWMTAEHELIWRPAIEVRRQDKRLVITAAVAGVTAEQLEVTLTGEDLLLQADIQHQHTSEDGRIETCEFHRGPLFRSVHFPERVQPEKARVELRNGLLRLTVPLAAAAPARRRSTRRT